MSGINFKSSPVEAKTLPSTTNAFLSCALSDSERAVP